MTRAYNVPCTQKDGTPAVEVHKVSPNAGGRRRSPKLLSHAGGLLVTSLALVNRR